MQPDTKKFLEALAILVGTILGVGTFGIPYAFSRAGFLVGLGYLAALALVVLAIHLMYGEIVLRTPQKHRLIGYAEIYLGAFGKRIAIIVMVVGILGTLLAYTIAGGAFSKVLFDPFFNLSAIAWSLIFFGAMTFFIITDFKTGAPAELAMNAALLCVFIFIIVRLLPDVSFTNFPQTVSSRDFFLPYGVILFALAGSAAVPELRDVLLGDARMKKIIVIGSLIPVALYALFALGVVGVMGTATTDNAITGLAARYGTSMALAGGLVGVLTTATSFLVLGLVLKHALTYDLRFSRLAATVLVIVLPLLLFLFATRDFVKVIGFVGSVLGGIEGLLMLKLHRAARERGQRTPEYTIRIPRAIYYLMGCIFAVGIVYEVVYTVRG